MSELTLRDYQIDTLTYYMRAARTLDRSEMGTGKTIPACVYSGWVVTKKNYRVVWIQKGSLLEKNRIELIKWAQLPAEQIKIVEGSPAKKKKVAFDAEVKIWLMTPESWKTYNKEMRVKFPNLRLLVCDEPHLYYRGWNSARTQAFADSLDAQMEVKMLTGTLTPRGKLSSAYIYAYVLDKGYYQHYDFFMRRHAMMDEYGSVLQWQNHEELAKFIAARSVFNSAKAAYGDTEEVVMRVPLTMSGKHAELYKKFEAEGILDLKTAMLKGTTGGMAYIRTRQLCNSPYKINLPVSWDGKGRADKWETTYPVSYSDGLTAKLSWLSDAFESYEKRMVVFGTFHAELEAIYDIAVKAGRKPAIIDGTISNTKRAEIDKQFAAGLIDVVIGSAETCSTGFNWGFVDWIIHASLDGSDDNYRQANFRAKRGVRTTPLMISILEYEESMDATMLWMIHHNSVSSHKVNPDSPIVTFPDLKTPTGFEIFDQKVA